MTRLELALEEVRAALEETARVAPDLLEGLVDEEWALRYGRRAPRQPAQPPRSPPQAGRGRRAAGAPAHPPPGLPLDPHADILRRIVVQHFVADTRGRLRPRTDASTRPPAATVVRFNSAHCNPYPVRSSCTSGTNPRNVYFLPQHLHELQQQNAACQVK